MRRAKGNGKRLYQCDDCKERRMVHWVELNRAAKPRCNKCGSSRLEIVSDDAYEERLNCNTQRVQGETRSVVLAAGLTGHRENQ
jgi:DNA-directed RNA polymerase subunit RPC12/RpoP